MSDMRTVRGFEDVWRPPVRPRIVRPRALLAPTTPASPLRDRLARIARRAPEVVVKVTGRTRDAAHLKAHLTYITRNGQLEGEDREGLQIQGRDDVVDTAASWGWSALVERARRRDAPVSVSLILSMPAGTDAIRLRDAARAFAYAAFAERHDYVLVLHTDTPRPHVHLSVRARGDRGERLNPKKADLEAWRQMFALALRDRGVEAEATPRRARGVTRKAERGPIRRMRERRQAGRGPLPNVLARAIAEAAMAATNGKTEALPWEVRMARRQAQIRALYRAEVEVLCRSPDAEDRRLAEQVDAFLRQMPAPDSQRLALARSLRQEVRDTSRADRTATQRQR